MARKPRKKKIAPIRHISDWSEEELGGMIAHLQEKYPTSEQLTRLEAEAKRRKEHDS